jgi:hypothetical protein
MSSLRDELASWRAVSMMLDELYTAKNANICAQTCEFHGKNDLCDAGCPACSCFQLLQETGS